MRKWRRVISLILMFAFGLFSNPNFVLALDTSTANFLNGSYLSNLVNDGSFIDINSMTVTDIQAFLVLKGSGLKDFSESGKSAAQIIYDAAHGGFPAAVGDWKGISISASTGTVSPKIILTYLEKEQGLISNPAPSQGALDCAMGYEYGQGCQYMFDNYPQLRGFTSQVGNGAWQLRYDYEYAKRGTRPSDAAIHYLVGETVSLPDQDYAANYNVSMTNAATASIYSYTPYVFDSAYNFWKIFNNWFTASADIVQVSENDTVKFVSRTFSDNVTIGGSKKSDSKVYFNNQLIQDTGTKWQLTFPIDIGTKSYTVEYKDVAGGVIATKALDITRHKQADINGDNLVDIQDLSTMATYWGQTKPAEPLTDLNGDGIVDILDLSLLASSWQG